MCVPLENVFELESKGRKGNDFKKEMTATELAQTHCIKDQKCSFHLGLLNTSSYTVSSPSATGVTQHRMSCRILVWERLGFYAQPSLPLPVQKIPLGKWPFTRLPLTVSFLWKQACFSPGPLSWPELLSKIEHMTNLYKQVSSLGFLVPSALVF